MKSQKSSKIIDVDDEEFEKERNKMFEKLNDYEDDESKYNLPHSWVGLVCICLQQISYGWVLRELTTMNSYKKKEKLVNEEFYKINTIGNYSDVYFSLLIGACYSLPYICFIIFSGYINDNYNRKNLVAFCCLTWSLLTVFNSYVAHVYPLLITRVIIGALQALSLTASYSLVNDMFPKRLRVRTFFLFSIIHSLEATL